MKYFRYYLNVFKMNIMEQMANRENFFVWILVHTISLISMFIFFKLIYSQIGAINGWTEYQSLLVLGVGTLVAGLGSATFFSFMYSFGRDVQRGDFDLKLLKPLDAHFLAAFSWVDAEDLAAIPNSTILIIYSFINLKIDFSIINFVFFLIMILSSMIILFSVLTLLQSLAFKAVKIDSMTHAYWSFVNAGKYPAKSIKNLSLWATILLFPIAFISSVPAEVLFGRYEWNWIIGSVLLSITLFTVSRFVFQKALKGYSSASS